MKSTRANRVAMTVLMVLTVIAAPASAQTPAADAPAVQSDDTPSIGQVFVSTLTNFRRIPTRGTLGWLIAGGVGAAATHPADAPTTRTLSGSHTLHEPLEAGALVGGTPFELGTAFATYGIGRMLHEGRVARLGADLIQAQLMAETLAVGVKQATRRSRPEGAGFSFPSGHTTVTFASADVLQRTFGWKVGAPAYAAASYVAASRIQNRRHYLSDVVFGAALGTIAGRTVAVRRSQRLAISPVASAGGAGIVFSLQRDDHRAMRSHGIASLQPQSEVFE